MTTYAPADAARRSGFSLDTLRYYEKIGLVRDVRRDGAGRRLYDDGDLDWLGVLRCLRDTGMPIADMRRYAALALATGADADATVPERLALLEEHAEHVTSTLELLHRQQQHLAEKIDYYRDLVRLAGPDPVAAGGGVRAH
jgi:DNA-binding transcriptional MerR regulator